MGQCRLWLISFDLTRFVQLGLQWGGRAAWFLVRSTDELVHHGSHLSLRAGTKAPLLPEILSGGARPCHSGQREAQQCNRPSDVFAGLINPLCPNTNLALNTLQSVHPISISPQPHTPHHHSSLKPPHMPHRYLPHLVPLRPSTTTALDSTPQASMIISNPLAAHTGSGPYRTLSMCCPIQRQRVTEGRQGLMRADNAMLYSLVPLWRCSGGMGCPECTLVFPHFSLSWQWYLNLAHSVYLALYYTFFQWRDSELKSVAFRGLPELPLPGTGVVQLHWLRIVRPWRVVERGGGKGRGGWQRKIKGRGLWALRLQNFAEGAGGLWIIAHVGEVQRIALNCRGALRTL